MKIYTIKKMKVNRKACQKQQNQIVKLKKNEEIGIDDTETSSDDESDLSVRKKLKKFIRKF